MLEIRILGPLEVIGEHGRVQLGGPKQRATLAILVLGASRVVPVERLADDLYRGAAPATAVTQVQRQVSELRRLLGDTSVIETRSPGYVMRLAPGQLDLHRFERQAEEAAEARARGDAHRVAQLLREALALWRGDALADLADEPFARAAIERLEEIRLAVLERRIDAELDLGRHAELVGELHEHVAANPFGERFRGQLMLALYRSGRQAEALDVYRATRAALIDAFGIEPTPALRELERAILRHDPALELVTPGGRVDGAEARRSVLLLPSGESAVDALLALAAPLGGSSSELVVARLIVDGDELAREAAMLNARRANLDADVRTAAFTTDDWTGDAIRLAAASDAALVLLDAPPGLDAALPAHLADLLERSAADVGVLAGPVLDRERGDGVFVPFGGGVHDWAALELAAWLASEAAMPLRLVGTKGDPTRGRRDASRLLADAALAVQRVAGVPSEPLLAEPSDDALVAALEPATLIVQGVSPRWRQDGIGTARRAVLQGARGPTLLVHGGPRPGGLAPRASRTRFTWSIELQPG